MHRERGPGPSLRKLGRGLPRTAMGNVLTQRGAPRSVHWIERGA
ncbi:hypothetical protein AZ22_2766 [Bordetella bronchiseptica 980-2]|nr:hypothetical protein AZ22_2766 [Bordetella bronchiseptica 980-2]